MIQDKLEELRKNYNTSYVNKVIKDDSYEYYGISYTELKKLAKDKNALELDFESKSKVFELDMVKIFVIDNMKSLSLQIEYINRLKKYLSNWAMTDSLGNKLYLKKPVDYEIAYNYALDLIKSKEEYQIRLAIIIFMNGLLTEEYLTRCLTATYAIKEDTYYINMAIAWYLQKALVKYEEMTIDFVSTHKFREDIIKKCKQKIRDSYCFSVENKSKLVEKIGS